MRPITMKWTVPILVLTIGLVSRPAVAEAGVADFENLALAPNGYFNGVDDDGVAGTGTVSTFSSGGLEFNNYRDKEWLYWDGWAYCNVADMTTPGYLNYSAYVSPDPGPGEAGFGGSSNYALAYNFARGIATIKIPPGREIAGAWITNATYAYLAIRDGNDGVPPEQGGPYVRPFTTGDWFKLEIFGVDEAGRDVGSKEFSLASYSGFIEGLSDPDQFIVTDWTYVDLSSLRGARSLEFALSSTDNHPEHGMNTPAFFAMDNVTTVAEPSAIVLFASAAFCGVFRWRRRSRIDR
jgi:hypothetical protein